MCSMNISSKLGLVDYVRDSRRSKFILNKKTIEIYRFAKSSLCYFGGLWAEGFLHFLGQRSILLMTRNLCEEIVLSMYRNNTRALFCNYHSDRDYAVNQSQPLYMISVVIFNGCDWPKAQSRS